MKEQFSSKHYITTRSDGAITDAWSSGPHPEKDTTDAICINEQGGYQFRLHSGGEENPPIYTMEGFPMYKYVNGEISLRTEEELNEDRKNVPLPPPSQLEQLRADVDFLLAMDDLL